MSDILTQQNYHIHTITYKIYPFILSKQLLYFMERILTTSIKNIFAQTNFIFAYREKIFFCFFQQMFYSNQRNKQYKFVDRIFLHWFNPLTATHI